MMINMLVSIGRLLGFAGVVVGFMLIGKTIAGWVFRGDREADERHNVALGLRRGGMYLAIAIVMGAALSNGSHGFVQELLALAKNGAIILGFLLIAQVVNDRFIVPGLDNDQAVASGNTAVGLTELGSYVATGLIAHGSFSGEGGGWLTAAAFFGLGQLALLAVFWLQELLLPGSFVHEVKNGNNAAGLMVAGVLMSLGIILQASVTGPFLSWVSSLRSFALYAAGGIVLLLLLQEVFNRFLLPRTRLAAQVESQANLAATTVAVCGQIGIALVISRLF